MELLSWPLLKGVKCSPSLRGVIVADPLVDDEEESRPARVEIYVPFAAFVEFDDQRQILARCGMDATGTASVYCHYPPYAWQQPELYRGFPRYRILAAAITAPIWSSRLPEWLASGHPDESHWRP
jgi:hypothetical protein